tara:strand:- start:128 stop:454 length:327 start_codon:yes stop_codon:yes gene_type:complete
MSDRKALIRLASTLPKGSKERKAILAKLKQPRGKRAKETRMGDYTVATQGRGLAVRPKGMGDMNSADDMGFPIYIEGTTLYVWGDINKEDPTHKINLAGALEKNRREE